MQTMEAAIAYANDNREAFLAQYKDLLAIPSVSAQSAHAPDIQRNAEWLADSFRALGMGRVEILPTAGHPAVYAESLKAPGKPTVLVYGHYDVQPVDPLDEWESDPFGGEIRGDYIYARGASDMKGQFFAQMKAVEALAKQDALPFNIKYLIEGEEEIGSPNLGPFIDDRKDLLQCDFVLNCDTGIEGPELPSLTYSLRGLAYFELELRTAKKDMHSGFFGGSVRNPLHVLAELIAGMHDENGRVTLPGFYDKVRPLDDEERALLAEIPYSDEEWIERSGSRALFGEAGYTTVERVGARPTLEINGMWGGYMEEGAKTVLPAKANAKISARVVADQHTDDVRDQLRAYLEANMPPGVDWKLIQHASGPGATMDRKAPYMAKAAGALETVFGRKPLFKRMGGSVPVVGLMQDKLGVDSLMMGFALPDDGIHGPNERQYLPNFYRGIETYIRFMAAL